MNIFDKIVKWLDNGEHSFVTFLSKIVPLVVPIIPAYVGYSHVVRELQFHPFFGWAYGFVIEGLGYSAIFKSVQFWEHNRHYSKAENKAPLLVAVSIYVVYLLVTLAVNVLLDFQSGIVWWKVLAVGGISLLSVPAGLLMSVSAVQTERKLQREAERQERLENKSEQPTDKKKEPLKVTNDLPVDWRKIRPSLSPDQVKFLAHSEPRMIVQEFAKSGMIVSPRTASNWRVNARKELNKKNPLSF